MESTTVGGLTFRWTDNTLLITTPTGQHLLNGRAAADLLNGRAAADLLVFQGPFPLVRGRSLPSRGSLLTQLLLISRAVHLPLGRRQCGK